MEKQKGIPLDKYCIGCKYYTKITDGVRYCSYMFRTDNRRPCPPGKDCTVRVERKKKNG